MATRDENLARLHRLPRDAWEEELRARSALPGPRANLELLGALASAVEPTDEGRLRAWAALPADQADGNDPGTFVAVCGLVGLGALAGLSGAEPARRAGLVAELRTRAPDPRWRVREAVAIALQHLGAADPVALLVVARSWAEDPDPFIRRALVAALAEPPLLVHPALAAELVAILGRVTADLSATPRAARRSPGTIALEKTLGYARSVAIVAEPAGGWPAFEGLVAAAADDPDLRRIARANLGKRRLARLDPVRTTALAARLSG